VKVKARYILPICGTVLSREPLGGDPNDPLTAFPLSELPNIPTFFDEKAQAQVPHGYHCSCLEYNIDEGWCEVEIEAEQVIHAWLEAQLPDIEDIQAAKGLKLDVSKLDETIT